METREAITLDPRAQQRLLVLTHLMAGELDYETAAAVLGLSVRHVRRLVDRYRSAGAAAFVHGNRGRAPANRLAEAVRAHLVELATTTYAGFNPVHLAETLAEEVGLGLPDQEEALANHVVDLEGDPRELAHRRHDLLGPPDAALRVETSSDPDGRQARRIDAQRGHVAEERPEVIGDGPATLVPGPRQGPRGEELGARSAESREVDGATVGSNQPDPVIGGRYLPRQRRFTEPDVMELDELMTGRENADDGLANARHLPAGDEEQVEELAFRCQPGRQRRSEDETWPRQRQVEAGEGQTAPAEPRFPGGDDLARGHRRRIRTPPIDQSPALANLGRREGRNHGRGLGRWFGQGRILFSSIHASGCIATGAPKLTIRRGLA